MYRSIGLAQALLILLVCAALGQQPSNQQTYAKIVLVGDSTVAAGGGWGPGFCALFKPGVICIDDALNGRSSKSFLAEGAWTEALAEKGNYYLIQFGHNDMKGKGPERETDPQTSFATNLERYITDARAIGATPILVTSLSRRTMKDGAIVEDLKDYAAATRRVGREQKVPVIDLNRISTDMLNHMTQADADKFNAIDQEKERLGAGKNASDRTHLNPMGQKTFGRRVADELVRLQPELRPHEISVAAAQGSPN